MGGDRLIRACRLEKVDRVPVWFMRQVGRYMPEYRELRRRKSFAEICRDPQLVAELSVLPVEKLGVDGAIVFSDILTPVEACGFRVRIDDSGDGVEVETINSEKDVERLRGYNPELTSFVYEGIKQTRKLLGGKVPVIGFAGAPFTLASYLIEGKPSRALVKVKQLMYSNEALWNGLMNSLAHMVYSHLREQVRAGASVVQLFDSWAGALSPQDYENYVLPWVRRLIAGVKELGCYVIHFATCSAGILKLMARAGGDVVGVDWRVDIADACEAVGKGMGVQGNLDPATLLASRKRITEAAKQILDKAGGRPGYIFNLGHGVLPETPEENLKLLVEYVHSYEVGSG